MAKTTTKGKRKDGTKDKRYRNKLNFSLDQELAIFKDMAHMTNTEIAKKYGIDKIYPHKGTQRLQVSNIASKIKSAPELYGITIDAIEVIDTAIQARRFENNPQQILVRDRERKEAKDKLDDIRDAAIEVLEKKLEKAGRSSKSIDGIKFKEVLDVISMSVEKSRLLRGESTDNVLHYAKIETKDLTPEAAMDMLLKQSEARIEKKRK